MAKTTKDRNKESRNGVKSGSEFLQSLIRAGFTALFKDTQNLLLSDTAFTERKKVKGLLQELLQKGFPLVVYLSDGRRFGLRSVRLHNEGCIELTLSPTKDTLQHFVIKPVLLRFYAASNAEESFFTLTTDPSFPKKEDIELLKLALSASVKGDKQPDPDYFMDTLPYTKTEEEEAEHRILAEFLNRFSLEGGSTLYLFFRPAPFNWMDEEVRIGALAEGVECLRALLENNSNEREQD